MYPGYSYLKYALPRKAQILLRQARARRMRSRIDEEWPIHANAATPPPGWKGWPDQKQFAFVITHDVDTARGLARCRTLARIERERGLRTAYYFVPEGRYILSDDLRRELESGGSEIGLHGLVHDWRTFISRRVFERRLPRLQSYLRDWNIKGFRAPSMVRNLDWIGEMDIAYDSSTFDTDPFEPQSMGCGTIFPYWVESRTAHRRYVELPYTLTQDFTLFVMLGEKNADVWKRKLDWIAEKGGMAMLIVHPDYLAMDDKPGREEFPIAWYLDFLDYVKQNYGDRCWMAQPNEVATYFAENHTDVPARSRHRVCMVAYAFYETDNRIIRYAETLAARGDQVDVLSLRRPGQSALEWVRGVRVQRIQERTRNEERPWTYLIRLMYFFFLSSLILARQSLRNRYHVIHIHSVPDFEVFAAWWPKLMGASLLLDIHDIVPEFYLSKFKASRDGAVYRWLLRMERWSCRFADHVIIANHVWYAWLVQRSAEAERCSVILNYVVSPPRRDIALQRHRNGRFLIVYPGGLQWHQGLDVAIRAFAVARKKIPGAAFHIYGEGTERPRLQRLVRDLGLETSVSIMSPVPFDRVLELLAAADLGIVAKRADSFGNEAYSTKILEYMSQGVPVIVSRTRIDQHYFDEQTVRFFTSGNHEELATTIVELARDHDACDRLIERGFAYVEENNWSVKQHDYLGLVDRLVYDAGAGRKWKS